MRKTSRLHQWDVLRANKAPFAFGLEPRVPFLDKDFVAAAMGVDPQAKMVHAKLMLHTCLCKPLCAPGALPAPACQWQGNQLAHPGLILSWPVAFASQHACQSSHLVHEPMEHSLEAGFEQVKAELMPAQIDMKARPDGRHPQMEKYILRKAFDLAEQPYLPEEVLWRQKEQFSDGVGYDWVDGLRAYAAEVPLPWLSLAVSEPVLTRQ